MQINVSKVTNPFQSFSLRYFAEVIVNDFSHLHFLVDKRIVISLKIAQM